MQLMTILTPDTSLRRKLLIFPFFSPKSRSKWPNCNFSPIGLGAESMCLTSRLFSYLLSISPNTHMSLVCLPTIHANTYWPLNAHHFKQESYFGFCFVLETILLPLKCIVLQTWIDCLVLGILFFDKSEAYFCLAIISV